MIVYQWAIPKEQPLFVRSTNIMQDPTEPTKICSSQVIVQCQNWVKSSQKFFRIVGKENWFYYLILLKKIILKILYLVKMCPIFVGSLHNNVWSDKVGCSMQIGPWYTIILGSNFPSWSKILKIYLLYKHGICRYVHTPGPRLVWSTVLWFPLMRVFQSIQNHSTTANLWTVH